MPINREYIDKTLKKMTEDTQTEFDLLRTKALKEPDERLKLAVVRCAERLQGLKDQAHQISDARTREAINKYAR